MTYKIISLSIMIVFYTFYIGKLLILNSNSIKTNQVGVGNKNKRTIIIERIMSVATITMKNSWRVGIPEEKTALITDGIHKWSRNLAFVGFDLLYLSILLIFWNIPLLIISIWAVIMLHFQILQEEEYMYKMFSKEYENYKKHTLRYWGRR